MFFDITAFLQQLAARHAYALRAGADRFEQKEETTRRYQRQHISSELMRGRDALRSHAARKEDDDAIASVNYSRKISE